MPIKHWPIDHRPREKLIKNGAGTLSNEELLAICLRFGIKGKSAIDLAHELILHFGSIRALCHASYESVSHIKGIGMAKFTQFQAILELALRVLEEDLKDNICLNSTQTVQKYLQLLIGDKPHESFTLLFLDVKNRLLQAEELFRGSLTHASVYPREIIKRALHYNAAAVILAHNHPSGVPDPSKADLTLTHELIHTLKLVDVKVLDHIVVTGNKAYSFAEHGLI